MGSRRQNRDGIIRALMCKVRRVITSLTLWILDDLSMAVDINQGGGQGPSATSESSLKAAHSADEGNYFPRGGIMNWGFDEIIQHDSAVRSDDNTI